MKITAGQWEINASLLIWVGFLLLLALFCRLGYWQYDKAKQRHMLESAIESLSTQSQQTPFSLTQALEYVDHMGSGLNDSWINTSGSIINTPIIVLDNRVHEGQAGYELLAVLQPSSPPAAYPNTNLLVNLGWHPFINGRRTPYPTVTLPNTQLTLTGKLYIPPDGLFQLDTASPWMSSSHLVVPNLTLAPIEQALNTRLLPFVLRITQSHPPLLLPELMHHEWIPQTDIGISSQKHIGYAFQWWSFSIILIGIFLFQTVSKRDPQDLKV